MFGVANGIGEGRKSVGEGLGIDKENEKERLTSWTRIS